MNINSWKNNTFRAFNNTQQQSFIQVWKASEKLKKTHLKARRNEDVQKFSARRPLGEDGDLERKENRKLEEFSKNFPKLIS